MKYSLGHQNLLRFRFELALYLERFPLKPKMIGLFELLQKVEKNSGMYLGRQSVSDLFMFLAGYEFARNQINEELTQAEEDFYNKFQPWLQQQLGVSSVTSWAKLIMLSCHDEKTGFEMFFKFLREFQVRDRVKEAVMA